MLQRSRLVLKLRVKNLSRNIFMECSLFHNALAYEKTTSKEVWIKDGAALVSENRPYMTQVQIPSMVSNKIDGPTYKKLNVLKKNALARYLLNRKEKSPCADFDI